MNETYPLALPENTVLAGQYIIQKVLGQGGFGITYKALDRLSGKFVAIKEYFPDSMATRTHGETLVMPLSGDRGENYAYGKECFLQEAETLARFIGNENIVRIYSYFEEYGTAYFVMDYIEGTSLDEFIKTHGGKLSFDETTEILIPIMDALADVHDKGIVHRDIAPDNIYLTTDGKVKLIDFGAARQSLGDKSQSLDVVLKHGFAPKEQYTRRGRQGPYTDIYALGATFYFALTGKRPPDSIERIDEDDIVLPSTLGARIPRQAEEAIMTALNVRAEERFQSMRTFKSEMLSVQEVESDSKSKTPDFSVSSNATQQRFFTAPEETSRTNTADTGQTVISSTSNTTQDTSNIQTNIEKTKHTKKTTLIAVGGVLAVAVILFVVFAFRLTNKTNNTTIEPPDAVPVEKAESPAEDEKTESPSETEKTESPAEIEKTESSAEVKEAESATEEENITEIVDAVVDDSKMGDYTYYKVPWGTSSRETLAQLGSDYSYGELTEDSKEIRDNFSTDLDYFGEAKGNVHESYMCDVTVDSQKWEGLCMVNISVWRYTQSDLDNIIKINNDLFGEGKTFEVRTEYMRWEDENTVVDIDFSLSSLMDITWYSKPYYDDIHDVN